MERTFDSHWIRQTLSLGGAWRFLRDPDDVGVKDHWQLALPAGDTVSVPSLWNNEPGLLSYEGVAWYEKKFFFGGGTLRLCFGAVMTEAEVWLDGVRLGSHYGGFTAFDFVVFDVERGEHHLSVRVDSRIGAQSIPQKRVDWFPFGGIAREVYAERLEGVCVLDAHLCYTLAKDLRSVEAYTELTLINASDEEQESDVCISLADDLLTAERIRLKGRERRRVKTATVTRDSLRLWSPEDPYLYPLLIQTETDDLRDRVGFRRVEVQDGKILLNGKRIELLGVNRHEEYPGFGFAFPESLMKRDLDLIADLGCNTVRGSHYPNSKAFVDLMDERGVLFWSEIPIWGCGFSEEALGDPVVVERGLQMHREMVAQYYNHPCIILWGMHNEIKSETQNAYEMTKKYAAFLRAEGGNRLITHASNHPLSDICFAFSDVISLNMYYGWYDQRAVGGADDWEGFLENFRARRAALGMEKVPVIMSEFGAAALYGYRDHFDAARWSEEYQANQLEHCLTLFHGDPMIEGFYLWQFANIRTSEEAGLTRARTFNNKGILDEYRNPKLAYHKVKSLYERFQKEE